MDLKEYASTHNFKKKTELYAELSRRFNIALPTAKKYYLMSDIDLPDPDKPKYYETNNSKLNGYRNIVYKMARDNINHIVIKEYVKSKGFLGTENSIEYFIKQLLKNNFNIILHRGSFEKSIEVPGLITIKRNDLLKFITTKNDRVKKDKNIEKYISLIKEKYPIINEIINVYNDFYNTSILYGGIWRTRSTIVEAWTYLRRH